MPSGSSFSLAIAEESQASNMAVGNEIINHDIELSGDLLITNKLIINDNGSYGHEGIDTDSVTFPENRGTQGQVLSLKDSTGQLEWAANSGGGEGGGSQGTTGTQGT